MFFKKASKRGSEFCVDILKYSCCSLSVGLCCWHKFQNAQNVGFCVQICINNLQPRQPRVRMTGRLWLCTKQLSESQKWASAAPTARARVLPKMQTINDGSRTHAAAPAENSTGRAHEKFTRTPIPRTSALNPRTAIYVYRQGLVTKDARKTQNTLVSYAHS